MTNASSSALWRQLTGQNIAPSFAAASEPLEHAERVLAEPEDAIAAAHAGGGERAAQAVHPIVELGEREADVAVEVPVDGGDRVRPAPAVLPQEVAEGLRLAGVGRHGAEVSRT